MPRAAATRTASARAEAAATLEVPFAAGPGREREKVHRDPDHLMALLDKEGRGD
jgi:hypothetical protein